MVRLLSRGSFLLTAALAPDQWDDVELTAAQQAQRRKGIHGIHASLRLEPRADERHLEVDKPKPIKTLEGKQTHKLTQKQKHQVRAPITFGGENKFQKASDNWQGYLKEQAALAAK